MAAVCHFVFANLYFSSSDFSKSKYTYAHQNVVEIIRLAACRYRDKTIFKMAVVPVIIIVKICHLDHVIAVCVWFILFSHSKSPNVALIRHWDITKTLFSTWRPLPSAIWICKNMLIFRYVTVLGIKIYICTPNFIEIGWPAAAWNSDKTFKRCVCPRHIGFVVTS